MLVWLDILTPKQLLFLTQVGERLLRKGYDVFYTTRQYREVDDLVKMHRVKALVVGRYGGPSLEEKLSASARRIEELSHIIARKKPALSIAFASPDAARTAFGLAIPHYTGNDSPHSTAVALLTIPLAVKLFSPAIIPKNVWIRLGAKTDRIVQYKGLDPIAWLRCHEPNPEVLQDLGLDKSHPIVIFRVEESFAAYLLGKASGQSVTIPLVKDVAEIYGDKIQIVVLARYPQQLPAIRSSLPRGVIVPSGAVDGPSLLSHTTLFVGAGGTMTAEASLLGVPTISCYPGEPTIVDRYLIREGLVERICEPKRAVSRIREVLEDSMVAMAHQKRRAETLMAAMEDPADVIVRQVEANFQL